ncbi:MAG: NfeD family protein [Roseivirga sp.]
MDYLILTVLAGGMNLLLLELLAMPETGTESCPVRFWGALGQEVFQVAVWVLAIGAGIALVLLVGGARLSQWPFFRRLALTAVQDAQQGYTARTYPTSLVGQRGTAQTPLHPAGKALIQGIRYDAKTTGGYVAQGAAVVVISVEGTSLTVQAID